MGKRGREILNVDVDKLIELMNKALSDEWLAYYQYWIGSKVIVGPMREAVEAELIEHANDELRHADLLAERITELGGTPVLSPDEWNNLTNCGYEKPDPPKVENILQQNIDGERCAIDVYMELMSFVEGKDPITEDIVREILTDEVEHEDDLEAIQEDMEDYK